MTRRPRRGDDGFVLPYVLLVMMLVTIAVTTLLVVTTPELGRVRDDQRAQGAAAAARAAVDDFIAYVGGVDACRTTTRVCAQALGASSTALRGGPTVIDTTTRTTMSWTTDAALADGQVRVHGVGTYGGTSRQLTADVALAPSILSYGYYSDYESQAPLAVAGNNPKRTIAIDNATYYNALGYSAALTAGWAGVSPVVGASTYPADCGTHWWADGSTAGRATNGSSWTDKVTLRNASDNATRSTANRPGTCNIVFTTGQTFDGPVYTRDALYLTQATVGGQGPVFLQPVLTGWGLTGHTTPAPDPTKPWVRGSTRINGVDYDLGNLSTASQKPKIANFDLTLPPTIGTEGVTAHACVYYGPTRAVLNANGTVTVTSPNTTSSRVSGSASDPRCYPSGLGSTGVVAYTLPVGAGHGTVFAKNYGTPPTTGWPGVGTKLTTTPSATNSVFYTSASGGVVDRANSIVAGDSCGTYAATVNAACAWTELPSFSSTSGGWTANSTSSACTATGLPTTDQRRFECEYSYGTMSSSTTGQPTKTYQTFRTAVKNAITTQCLTGTVADRTTCLTTALNSLLPKTTSWRYAVTGTPTAGTAVTGTAVSAPGTPTTPFASDTLFDSTVTPAVQKPTTTPVTFVVSRQTSSDGGKTWANTAGAFSLTASLTQWDLTPGTASSWFPKVADVTVYGAATSSAGPGDLYVQGNNSGKHSLLADNDVVVTGDVVDATDNVDTDAVNLVAGADIRNQNPVRCDTTATDPITRTDPGFCPNDLFGMSSNLSAGSNSTLDATHPANRYVNLNALGDRRIDAALFALQGSFQSDNYYRGAYVGKVTINGGLYQKFRGTNGVNYTLPDATVAKIGYSLNYHYVDLRKAYLPYEPTTRSTSGRLWTVTTVYGSGPS